MSERQPADPLESMLLSAARSQRAPASARAHVRAAVGLAAGAGTLAVATAAGAAAGKHTMGALTAIGIAKYLAVGMACGALTLGASRWVASPAKVEMLASVAPVASQSATLVTPVVPPVPPPAAASPSVPSLVVTAAPAASSAPAIPALAAEIVVLDEARGALRGRDAATALRALDRYAKEFPHGQMSAEAMMLRVKALVQSGDRATAESLAKSFESANPRSPLIERVHAIVGEQNP
jgi:hypothetical protein